MLLIQLTILALVAISGTIVVLARDVASQPTVVSLFGLILALMFLVFQAPDVSLSQIVVGAVGLPLMILLTLAKLRRDAQILERKAQKEKSE
ncbi:MAG TPA: hydrogenase subunit MbhD domain-containing protein [Candidatus Acidoferrales bacterium]|jgi:uncharacterized MnhB-related membrane protein|nr:hydrogenase subunit MbhD domain-containing protein [Candidatus Acidoferrales bacterium]